jgi:NAD+ synthase (glutamine-hydrolysing)
MKIALSQLNYIVGDFGFNRTLMLENIMKASKSGVDLIIFSELSICGYPPLDLLERKIFVEKSTTAIQTLASEMPADIGVLLGAPEINEQKEGKLLFNSAYFLYNGKVKDTFRKSLLPTYDIFDEYRYFEPNKEFKILEFKGNKIAVTVCEDLWDDQPSENHFSRSNLYTINPMRELMNFNPDFIVNIAASPFSFGRQQMKRQIFTDKAKKHGIPVFMVNQTGANTELIFEGGSLAVSASGSVAHQLNFFENDYVEFELEDVKNFSAENLPEMPDRIGLMHDALVIGIRDYFQKSGFTKATLGLSGGIDSAVTLAIAAKALGNENLHVLLMPSQYSSDHSIADSEEMAKILDVSYDILPIEEAFNLYRLAMKPVFKDRPEDVAEENIQSRIRATLLMALSNKLGHILLNTSNKSETAVGYGTLYGDMAGGLSVIGDVYKTDVYALARYINENKVIIPGNIITKPPSAELRPNQKDSDSLPDYDMLDTILEKYIERQMSDDDIIAEGFDSSIVKRIIRLVNNNEYKRYQTPPILRISSKAFGVGRRIPLVAKY